jgi:argininosuccinate synthase
MNKRVVLAYSGGLDTSVAIKWLMEQGFDVITLTADVGQQKDLKGAVERARQIGATKSYLVDCKNEFIEEYVWPSLMANAQYEGYPLSSALSRPLICKKLVDVAEKEGAGYIAHGCTGKGNDQVRFELSIKALSPEKKIIAPNREWGLSREEGAQYALDRGIPIPDPDYLSRYSDRASGGGIRMDDDIRGDAKRAPVPRYFF